jgi:CubicO group peptidase (beta-lactamase class C family)
MPAQFSLRLLAIVAVAVAFGACSPPRREMPESARISPTNGWAVSAPEEQGIDSEALIKGYQSILDKGINVHAMLIVRNGRLVSEAYFSPNSADDMINIHSCTKSILSALVGIAIQEGSIRSVNQKITDFFPAGSIRNLSARKQKITIRHLLTMSPGLAVHHPDDDMKSSPDWVQHVLDLDMADEPGTRFNYSDATAHLVSALLQRATGMSAAEYARTRLFKPMGITVLWPSDPQGVSMGFSEINMTPRDMAKIGLLYLNKGVWDGRQIVPVSWIRKSTSKKIAAGTGDDYGYFWWCPQGSFQARGAGEQYIVVAPSLNVVAVITNGLARSEAIDLSSAGNAIKGSILPPNPDALRRLRALEILLNATRPPLSTRRMPAVAERISGRLFAFSRDANPLKVKELTLDFSGKTDIVIRGTGFDGNRLQIALPSDGSFRKDATRTAANDTIFQRCYWKDDSTFVVRTEKSQFEELSFTFEGAAVTLRYAVGGTIVFDHLRGASIR